MKYFILIISLGCLWSIGEQLFRIPKFKTGKDSVDELLAKNKTKTQSDLNIIIASLVIVSIIPLLYLLFSAIYVNTFCFTVICCGYAGWSIFDMTNAITYMKSCTLKDDPKNIEQAVDKIYTQLMDSLKIDKDLRSKVTEVTIPKTLNSKLYKILSLPLDLAFILFIIYQVFIKW